MSARRPRPLWCAASVGGAVLLAVAASGSTGAAGVARTPAADASCRPTDVRARIHGRPACLRDGQVCRARLESAYRRYRLTCASGRLQVPWKLLYRPLHIPRLDPGAACATTPPDPRGDLRSILGWAPGLPAWGTGPAFPLLVGPRDRPVLTFKWPPPPEWGQEWSGGKVLWAVERSYEGRTLVRGREVNGTYELRFAKGGTGFSAKSRLHPALELRVQGSGAHPSTTRVRAPGCYAYQVD